MSRALVLACGNAQRGDDAVALHIAGSLRSSVRDPQTEIHSYHQWAPELAEPISKAEIAIFVDAAAGSPPGTISCRQLQAAPLAPQSLTHHTSPESLLWLAQQLYGKHPQRAHLVTVTGASFDLSEQLSDPVHEAIPHAVERIKALLSSAPAHET